MVSTTTSWYNQIISTLNFSSFGRYTFPSYNTKSSSTYYLTSLNTFISAFFILSTTLTTFSFFPLAIFIFLIYLLLVLLLLLLISYKSNSLLKIFDSHCPFPHLLSSPVFYLIYLPSPFLFLEHVLR